MIPADELLREEINELRSQLESLKEELRQIKQNQEIISRLNKITQENTLNLKIQTDILASISKTIVEQNKRIPFLENYRFRNIKE